MNISNERLLEIYGESEESKKRFEKLERDYIESFGQSDTLEFFTSPGRTEIVGNHTDHNGGKVIAGSITMDTVACASVNGSDIIEIISEGYPDRIIVDLNNDSYVPKKTDTEALLYGMVAAIKAKGYKIKGFNAYVTTSVLPGAGVSSSASFEMLFCTIADYFFNENEIDYIEYAKIGQYAENKYWYKGSGLMDQLACAVGGIIKLDFAGEVKYEKVPFDFGSFDYEFILVNSSESHANLSDVYSSVPNEMYEVAEAMNVKRLGDTSYEEFLDNIDQIATEIKDDRAILRAFHFYQENERVEALSKAMASMNSTDILSIIKESGNSSWKYLQNCYVPGISKTEGVSYNLALSETINQKLNGVCRVHGGGFCGVMLEVVPSDKAKEYIEFMAPKVGRENIFSMKVRSIGATHI